MSLRTKSFFAGINFAKIERQSLVFREKPTGFHGNQRLNYVLLRKKNKYKLKINCN